jgi:hypothetical protein
MVQSREVRHHREEWGSHSPVWAPLFHVPVHPTPASRWRALLGDLHFWIPVAVLLAGLLVLQWIA